MKVKMKVIITIVFLFIACAPINYKQIMDSYNNVPFESVSKFDGTKTIGVKNCVCSSKLAFDLYQTTALNAKGVSIIKARVTGIKNIGDKNSLLFNVDGQQFAFSPTKYVTQFENAYPEYPGGGFQISTKKYIVPDKFINKLSNAYTIIARINFDLSETYIEAACHQNEEWRNLSPDLKQKAPEYKGIDGFKKYISLTKTAFP